MSYINLYQNGSPNISTFKFSALSKSINQLTVQITFSFICQTHLVFGKCVCTCVRKHSNALCVCLVSKILICERLVGLVSFETNVSKTAGQIRDIELACLQG